MKIIYLSLTFWNRPLYMQHLPFQAEYLTGFKHKPTNFNFQLLYDCVNILQP